MSSMTEPIILAGSPLFYLLLAVIGLLTGTYGTMVGLGGGIILLPVLLFLFPDAPPEALTGISLSVVLINALSGTAAYARHGRIDYRSGALFAVATIPGTIIGVWLLRFVEMGLFSTLFGALLLAVSVLIILRPRTEPAGGITPQTAENKGGNPLSRARRALGTGLSFVVGFIAGLLGIGGGIIHVPMMIYVLRFPLRVATATSQFILIFTTLTGVLTHLALGTSVSNWMIVVCLALGVIPGAQLGAHLSRRLRGTVIIRLLALALIILGVRLIF